MPHRLTQSEFATMLQDSARPLWCIAAAVLGDRSQAEDVVQDAAIIGLSKLEEFEPGTSFRAWMGQIVRNVARNQSRYLARRPHATADQRLLDAADRGRHTVGDRPLPVTPDGSVRSDQRHFDDEVVTALQDLGEQARSCLLLRTVLDLSYAEISELLGIPPGTAMSHVHRARREMRSRLTGDRTAASSDRGTRRA